MPRSFLELEERKNLIDILANLTDWESGLKGRDNILFIAGLKKFSLVLDIDGAPRNSATTLIQKLEEHGFLTERPNHHALGALLRYLLTLEDTPPADLKHMADIVVTHELVQDEPYIKELREKYYISNDGGTRDPIQENPSGEEIAKLSEELFVNRVKQLTGLNYLLKQKGETRIMFVEADEDMGKSWLLLEMNRKATGAVENNIGIVFWDFAHQRRNYLSLVREAQAQLDGDYFEMMNQLIYQSGLSTRSDDSLLQQWEIRITEAFLDCLKKITQTRHLLFLLDAAEHAPVATEEWLRTSLLEPIGYKQLANVSVIITGRSALNLPAPLQGKIAQTGLSLLEVEHIDILLSHFKKAFRNIALPYTPEELHKETGGHPGRLGSKLDELVRSAIQDDMDPESWIG